MIQGNRTPKTENERDFSERLLILRGTEIFGKKQKLKSRCRPSCMVRTTGFFHFLSNIQISKSELLVLLALHDNFYMIAALQDNILEEVGNLSAID